MGPAHAAAEMAQQLNKNFRRVLTCQINHTFGRQVTGVGKYEAFNAQKSMNFKNLPP
jgi:malate/lactate dehydrogenase